MALVKHNNNSISAVTSMASLTTGSMTLISEQTASSSASVSFTTGIDSTYPIYKFEFINIHPATDQAYFQFNMSIDGGSNYNVTKTTTYFEAWNNEADNHTALVYSGNTDLAQSTSAQYLQYQLGNDNDQNTSGEMFLYNPSSSVFVKHFMSRTSATAWNDYIHDTYVAGYGNTTSSVDAVQFSFSSGNIDAGTIKLYGIKDS